MSDILDMDPEKNDKGLNDNLEKSLLRKSEVQI